MPAPANLPDGPWRRKAVKIKQELIVKSKIKKEYAKVKARVQEEQPTKAKDIFAETTQEDGAQDKAEYEADQTQPRDEKTVDGQVEPEIHPDRIAMLDEDEQPDLPEDVNGFRSRPDAEQARNRDRRRQQRKPGYFEKELAEAERKKAEAEARAAERERREKEREKAIKERERHRRIMAKARSGGRDGKRKLGKESFVMLDRVKRLVGQK